MDKQQVIEELKDLITEGKEKILTTQWRSEIVLGCPTYVDQSLYAGWHTKVVSFLRIILPDDSEYLKRIIDLEKHYLSHAESAISILENALEYVEKGFLVICDDNKPDSIAILKLIFKRFHRVGRQLQSRYNQRPTLEINDEYDVQDLLHALLRLYFDDVRAEEWTPSYSGKSARMDFLLKKEGIVIEVKKTRQGLTDRELGDQLIIDVDRYQSHPDCRSLICFVYDPEGRIGNPEGISKDLNEQHKGFVEVIIEPNY